MTEVNRTRSWAVAATIAFVLACLASVLLTDEAQAWNPATTRNVTISCAQDIDNVINGDPVGTATRFVLDDSCTHTASAVIHTKDGDEVACETLATYNVLFGPGTYPISQPTAFDPVTHCTVTGGASAANVFHPDDSYYMEGIRVTGPNMSYSGTGTGSGIAEGQAANDSRIQYVEVTNTPALGIANAHGVHHGIELWNTTTDSGALGITGSGIKGVDEFNIEHSYVHDNQGNGIWGDVYSNDVTNAPFTSSHWNSNLVEDNGRAGLRWEEANDTGQDSQPNAGEVIVEHNRVYNNATEVGATHGGVDVRDAAHALIRNNIFDNNADGIAIRVTDSGRSDRPDVADIDILNNTLNGDTISGNRDCSFTSTTFCSGNTP